MISMVAAALALGGCGSGPPLPPKPPTIEIKMTEYRFQFSASSVPQGRVIFHVVNAGSLPHDLALIPLPADFPPLAEQLRGATRRVVNTLAGVPLLQPGESDTFAVDLVPSRYAIVCFLLAPDGISEARKGMAFEFRVR